MRNKRRALPAFLLMISLILPNGALAAGAEATPDGPQTTELSTLAAEKAALLTDTYGTTSVQYALIDNGEIVVSGQAGINDKQGQQPLTKNTTYGIGSTSKMFTTAAVMKLVEQGKISLDTPLTQYIAEFKMKDDRYKQITPRMLLNHSSGLQGSSLTNAFLLEDNDTYAHDTLLEQLSGQSLKADPGAFSVYCNDGFTLAEILVERVSGMDFTSFIHQHFTEPLNMEHTQTPQDAMDTEGMAALYYPAYPEQLPNETVNAIGTGGIYSTAEDLVTFASVFTGEAGILSESSLKATGEPEYRKGLWPPEGDSILGFGLGWDSVNAFPFSDYDIKAWVKGGDTLMYHASLIVLPEHKMAAAVLSSGGSSNTNQLLANELLLQALKEKGTIKEWKPAKSFGTPVQADLPKELEDYTGYYGGSNQLYYLKVADGALFISQPGIPEAPEQKLIYVGDGAFVSDDGAAKVSFVKENNGRTYLWERQYATVPELGQLAVNVYSVEKLEEQELSPETTKAWEQRQGKTYYLVSEKYSSFMYFLMEPILGVDLLPDALPGYWIDKPILGPDTAVSQHQIPIVGSRDTAEYRFLTKNGAEYLEAAGSSYISEDAIKPIYAGQQSVATLKSDETVRWYTIPAEAAGKTMTVSLPDQAAYAVYDANGLCVSFSVVHGNGEVTLPEEGSIALIGDPGAVFAVSLITP
ncbi:serine hydrolase domain-containing protein [Paenibacillus sanguinis]|uniref:serine hydrolase domain-containing protein n=1 Tax=Paenibacillus sanguinis TaxID=225906 RepID=UPI000382F04B|nr:serine hydrolase domain-containing protein [Paenibacillus sanguinis]